MFGYKLFYAIFACVPDPESGRKPFRSETAGRTADRSFLTVTGRRAFRKAPFYRHTKSILPMKRFLTFLFAASALLAGGCSDSELWNDNTRASAATGIASPGGKNDIRASA